MPVHDDLGTRMKTFYEEVPKTKLIRRMPVAIRIDGKAFHTFTKGFDKPFDDLLVDTMQHTTKYLCENIQGCVFGYTQSDEITLILVDYKKLNTSAWFDYEVQKMCSIASSMATMCFNRQFIYAFEEQNRWINEGNPIEKDYKLNEVYYNAMKHGATFDARCFNIPKEEVCNLIYWRQLDAIRNSIQMLGQANFSHKELHNKSCEDIKNMLYSKYEIWDDLPIYLQRGTACIKQVIEDYHWEKSGDLCAKVTDNFYTQWILDKEMPLLKGCNRKYIENLIYVGD